MDATAVLPKPPLILGSSDAKGGLGKTAQPCELTKLARAMPLNGIARLRQIKHYLAMSWFRYYTFV
jgi:hypothetical protein